MRKSEGRAKGARQSAWGRAKNKRGNERGLRGEGKTKLEGAKEKYGY